MASRSSGSPAAGVYLWNRGMRHASTAASTTCAGVGKSGSPAPKPMTGLPAALSALALASTARVADSAMAATRREMRRSAGEGPEDGAADSVEEAAGMPPSCRWGAGSSKGCSSIGRAAVSKTAGCRFKSCHPCSCRRHLHGDGHDPYDSTTTDRRPEDNGHHQRGERGAVSDEKPAREGDPRAASDAAPTDEQLDREAPGVADAAELEAAEAELAAEAETDEDKVVAARPTGARRGSRITAGDDEDDDESAPRTRRTARERTPSRPAE